jgi:hypothetical protein
MEVGRRNQPPPATTAGAVKLFCLVELSELRFVFSERPEAHLATAFIDLLRILEGLKDQPAFGVLGELRAVELPFAVLQANTIDQVGIIGRRGFTAFDGAFHQSATSLHEVRVLRCMLDQKPRGIRAVLADEGFARPAMLVDDFLQSAKVAAIDCEDAVKIRCVESGAAHALIGVAHFQQFPPKGVVERGIGGQGLATGDEKRQERGDPTTHFNAADSANDRCGGRGGYS